MCFRIITNPKYLPKYRALSRRSAPKLIQIQAKYQFGSITSIMKTRLSIYTFYKAYQGSFNWIHSAISRLGFLSWRISKLFVPSSNCFLFMNFLATSTNSTFCAIVTGLMSIGRFSSGSCSLRRRCRSLGNEEMIGSMTCSRRSWLAIVYGIRETEYY